MRKSKKLDKHGFVLIELIVVIAILGILSSILIPLIVGLVKQANNATDLANARNLYNSILLLIASNSDGTGFGDYPYLGSDFHTLMELSGSPGIANHWDYSFHDNILEWARYGDIIYYSDGSNNIS